MTFGIVDDRLYVSVAFSRTRSNAVRRDGGKNHPHSTRSDLPHFSRPGLHLCWRGAGLRPCKEKQSRLRFARIREAHGELVAPSPSTGHTCSAIRAPATLNLRERPAPIFQRNCLYFKHPYRFREGDPGIFSKVLTRSLLFLESGLIDIVGAFSILARNLSSRMAKSR
jgi:hypothetical protein